ncbi:MAG: hypothetical protein KDA72_22080, partial [Planctomycetales bacterium]|nr:hypothetical protein [Planctomycetales bacterium]
WIQTCRYESIASFSQYKIVVVVTQPSGCKKRSIHSFDRKPTPIEQLAHALHIGKTMVRVEQI